MQKPDYLTDRFDIWSQFI